MPNENPVKTIFLQVVVKILATVRYNLMVLEGCTQLIKILFMCGCLFDFWLCIIGKFVNLCPTDRDFHERNEIGRLSCKKDLWEGLSLARLDRARRRALAVCWRSIPSHRSEASRRSVLRDKKRASARASTASALFYYLYIRFASVTSV